MAPSGLAFSAAQPRHLYKSDNLVAEEEVLLMELENFAVLDSLLHDGCVRCRYRDMRHW
jgi:hypothetical protein